MPKVLIVAEKPSVARDIAAALGGFRQEDRNVHVRADAIVTSAHGHLIEIGFTQDDDHRWELHQLPVLPPGFELRVIKGAEATVSAIRALMQSHEVSSVINACDAGREGELIFGLIADYLRCRKPVQRMWLQSMTRDSIRAAYAGLRPGAQFHALLEAARSRSEADLLIGANGTRALTKLHEMQTHRRELASAGRVQTPTLAMVVDRELAILAFVPRDYWEVHASFRVAAGQYTGKWFDAAWRKGNDEDARSDRMFDRRRAQEIEQRCQGVTPTSVRDESKPVSTMPPRLFDLTTLQREGNVKLGLSAKQTLDIAQALYERHKVLTYPRTDSSALPEDYVDSARQTVAAFASGGYAEHAQRVLDGGWVRADKRIFDNSKISDHFAIIPTGEQPQGLDDAERRVFDLVVRRFLAVFHPAAQYLQTRRVTVVAGESFKSEGRVLVQQGWLAVYGRVAENDEPTVALCAVGAQETPSNESIRVVALKTRPPLRFTEATLLAAMEGAGRMVGDDAMRDAMKERGLGTPATRAAVIEGLLSEKKQFMRRERKDLVPTQKGIELVELLRVIGVQMLTSPDMTGEWEHKLVLMQKGGYSRQAFMAEVAQMTQRMIDQVRARAQTMPKPAMVELQGVRCPKCSAGAIRVDDWAFECGSCAYKLRREIAGRALSADEGRQLLEHGGTELLEGFKSKAGCNFAAKLRLTTEGAAEFVFEERKTAESGRQGAGLAGAKKCPRCQAGKLLARNGARGSFFGCSNYPKCKHTEDAGS